MTDTNKLMGKIYDLNSAKGPQRARQYFDALEDKEKGELIGSSDGWIVFRYFGADATLTALSKLPPKILEKTFKSPEMAGHLDYHLLPTKEEEQLLSEIFQKLSPQTLDNLHKALDQLHEKHDLTSWGLRRCENSLAEMKHSALKFHPRLFVRKITPKNPGGAPSP